MKAVIMAGGEGSRLRPLTCDIPKPMARLCGRPVIEYILELLKKHGCTDAAVTLRYMPNEIAGHFPDEKYNGINLTFVTEPSPLGTAGSVKNAAQYDEDFIVISGDAMCDFDLTEALNNHHDSGADVTIIVKRVDDPREYGLVSVNEEGFVTGFVEKPSWHLVTTNLANTGIYIIKPSVMDLIPENRSFDFAANLFPLMLSKGMKIKSCEMQGYWCDIGDLQTYLSCQQDMLMGRLSVKLPKDINGVFYADTMPKGNYKVFAPVYIGSRVKIADGAVIGPDAVLDDGVTVCENARVRSSVVLPESYIGASARLTGGVVCAGASVKAGVSIYEGSTVGSKAYIGENSEIMSGVCIWPSKRVEENTKVTDNVRYGTAKPEYFDDDGISGEAGIEITPEFCARVGAAAGSLKSAVKIGIGGEKGNAARAFCAAFASGALSTGMQVWDFGELTESQMTFAAAFCGLSAAAYITAGAQCSIKILGDDGLPVTRSVERELQGYLQKGEFIRCGWSGFRDKADLSGIKLLYQQELYRCAPKGLSRMSAAVRCSNPDAHHLLEDTLSRLGCDIQGDMVFELSKNATHLAITMPSGERLDYDRTLALCCLCEFKRGKDVVLPYDAPLFIEQTAQKYSRSVIRYHPESKQREKAQAKSRIRTNIWLRDGMMLGIKLLAFLREENCSIEEIAAEIPDFSTITRTVSINEKPSGVMKALSDENNGDTGGVMISRADGNLFIRPNKQGRAIKILAQAQNSETAVAFCDEMESKIIQLLDNGKKK